MGSPMSPGAGFLACREHRNCRFQAGARPLPVRCQQDRLRDRRLTPRCRRPVKARGHSLTEPPAPHAARPPPATHFSWRSAIPAVAPPAARRQAADRPGIRRDAEAATWFSLRADGGRALPRRGRRARGCHIISPVRRAGRSGTRVIRRVMTGSVAMTLTPPCLADHDPLVILARGLTVANVDSIGLVVRRCTQCPAG
jgi:hypothetical protein